MRVEVAMLYAGQGMCNCIQVYNSANALQAVLVIDIGSSAHGMQGFGRGSWGPVLTDAVTFVTDAVRRNNGVLNVLVLSHLDADHYNYLEKITNITSIGVLVIGGTPLANAGEDWNTQYANYVGRRFGGGLTRLHRFLHGKYQSLWMLDNDTDYAVYGRCTWFHEEGNERLELRTLVNRCFCGQEAAFQGYNSGYINGNSAVMVLEYYIFPQNLVAAIVFLGDAISETFQEMNQVLGGPYCLVDSFYYRAVTAAHHGSWSTHYRKGDGVGGLGNLRTFVNTVRPELVYVSACELHYHPNKRVVDLYGSYTGQESLHDNRLWRGSGYREENCDKKVFSSYYKGSIHSLSGERHRYRRVIITLNGGTVNDSYVDFFF